MGPASAAVASDYLIRAGDVLTVTVYGEPTLTQPTAKVVPGGTIVEPLAGQVRVAGLTCTQAAEKLTAALTHYVRHPIVTIGVDTVGPVDIYVLGNVKVPGRYQLTPESHLMDALAAAGGLGPTDGDLPDAHLAVGSDVTQVSLQKLLHEGDLTQNVAVANDMTVYIPSPLTFNVQVYGAVDHPGDVVAHEGDRLLTAIARAGNSPGSQADLNHVKLQRVVAGGKVETTTYNLYDVIKSGDLAKDPLLAKGDAVYVPQGAGRRDIMGPAATIFYALRLLIP
jgi:polysaccharide export outer membrane protein